MLFYLFLLFVVVPLSELFLLFKLAELTSPSMTLGLVIITGAFGSLLAKAQGLRTLHRVREELALGRMPTDSLVDAVMILVAGALLLTPGMLTDLFGFSLLIPICRRFYRRVAKQWFQRNFKIQTFATGPEHQPRASQVIDSYVVDSANETDEEL